MAALLALYLVFAIRYGLLLIGVGQPVGDRDRRRAARVLPVLGAGAMRRRARVRGAGRPPRPSASRPRAACPTEELPLLPSGRIDRAAADAVFPQLPGRRRGRARELARLVPARPRLRRQRRPPPSALGDAPGDQAAPRTSRSRGPRRCIVGLTPRRSRRRSASLGTTSSHRSSSRVPASPSSFTRERRAPAAGTAGASPGRTPRVISSLVAGVGPARFTGPLELRAEQVHDRRRLVVQADPRPVLLAASRIARRARRRSAAASARVPPPSCDHDGRSAGSRRASLRRRSRRPPPTRATRSGKNPSPVAEPRSSTSPGRSP